MKNLPSLRTALLFAVILSCEGGLFAQMTEAEQKNLQWLASRFNQEYLTEQEAVKAYIKKYGLSEDYLTGKNGLQICAIENGLPLFRGIANDGSVRTISANHVKTGGSLGLTLTGAGQTLGVWEAFEAGGGAAIRTTHQDFGGRASMGALQNNVLSSHATHVSGTMIGNGSSSAAATGFASGANLIGFDGGSNLAEMTTAAGAATPIRVSNHSYGFYLGWDSSTGTLQWLGDFAFEDWRFGAYNSTARAWDDMAFATPFHLAVKAAMNERGNMGVPAGTMHVHAATGTMETDAHELQDGGADGYDCIPLESTAKNILTVGAVSKIPGGYANPGSAVSAGFSGWGPTDDGRVKPDVVAAGVSLWSCDTLSNTDHSFKSGTSMATPSVSGGIGLLLEHWQNVLTGVPRAATMKGLLIHQADECGPNNGPDYQMGWGLVNIADAAELITIDGYEGCEQIVESSVAAGNTFSYTAYSSGLFPLKVTIVWADPPPPMAAVNAGTINPAGVSYLVNDLDLRVDDGVSTFFPWTLDPANPANAATTGDNNRDNVEQVLLLNPTAGTYTIRVVAPAVLTSGPQNFSLLISGNGATIDNATYSFLTINNNRTYAVRQDLTFGPAFVVTNTGDVNGYAGHSISLVPGFHAQMGGRFLARILPGGGCGQFSGDLKADNYPVSRPENTDVAIERQQALGEVSNLAKSLDFQVSPNPVTDAFSIRFEVAERAPVSLQLSDAAGKLVYQWYSQETFDTGEHTVEANDLPLSPGIYYVELKTPSARRVRKFVKVGQ